MQPALPMTMAERITPWPPNPAIRISVRCCIRMPPVERPDARAEARWREKINASSARLKSCPDTKHSQPDLFRGPLDAAFACLRFYVLVAENFGEPVVHQVAIVLALAVHELA